MSGRTDHGGRRGREPQTLSQALDEVLQSLQPAGKPGPSAKTVGGVFARWEDAVGEGIASHARPVRLSDGVLVVEVDDPAWATQVKFLELTVRTRLQEVAGVTVERLEVRVARRR